MAGPRGLSVHRLSELAARDVGPIAGIGEKAGSLVELARHGFSVPDGLCIPTDAFEAALAASDIQGVVERARASAAPEDGAAARDAIARCKPPPELESALASFLAEEPGGALAVRSSGTCEDLAGASFAGLYQSVLGVRTLPALIDAVRACWAAAFAPRVLQYCADRGVDTRALSLALLVQRLVPAEKSGVLFSVDPVRGNDTVVLIEAAFGLGETLVSGAVSPDRYRFDWYHGAEVERAVARKEIALFAAPGPKPERVTLPPERRDAPVLDADEVRALAELGAGVQEATGRPVDLEWAIADGEIRLLQSRPITRIAHAGVPGEWTTADFRDGGVASDVCTPFMASLYRFVFDRAAPAYFDRLGLRGADPLPWTSTFFARPYWNLGAARARMRRLPGFTDASFEEGVGIDAPERESSEPTRLTPRSLVTGLHAGLMLRRSCRAQLRRAPRFAAAQRRRLAELDAIDPRALPREALFAFFERFLREEYFRSEATYFDFVYDNANLTTQFREAFHSTKSSVAYPLLLGGLRDVAHLAPSLALWDLSRAIRARPAWRDHWRSRAAAELVAAWRRGERGFGLDAFADCVRAQRHHSTRELDISVPRFDEDPTLLAETLKAAVELDADCDPRRQARAQEAASAEARARFLAGVPLLRRGRMRRRLGQVRDFLWWREELRDLSTRFYYHVRRLALAVGSALVRDGALRAPGDVFFLSMDEIFAAAAGRLPTSAVDPIVRRNRRYTRSFRNFEIPNEIGLRGATEPQTTAAGAAAGRVLAGVPCSTGVARGRARVIADIFDADRLERGDVLITRCTDPGWTPKFGLLAAVATETGGLLSHAAVISREYGIPAVLAVPRLTRVVRDGEIVVVDGAAGTVTLEDRAP